MQITNIQQQLKDKARYSVYIDGKYSFSLSEQTLLACGLRTNQKLSSKDLAKLKDDSVFDKAYSRALNLLARRARSEWELRDYLRRKQYEQALIDQLIEKLALKGYVDDKDFAKRWIENRRLLKQSSRRKLWQELKTKRVSDETIQSALDADETNERQVVLELAKRKASQSRYKDTQKLMMYLSRQGFNYDDIKWAVEQLKS